MITQQTQIKINLPIQLKDFLESKARKYGLPIATYVKHLILKEIKDLEYPEFEPSERTIKKAEAALRNKNKSTLVEDLQDFFKKL